MTLQLIFEMHTIITEIIKSVLKQSWYFESIIMLLYNNYMGCYVTIADHNVLRYNCNCNHETLKLLDPLIIYTSKKITFFPVNHSGKKLHHLGYVLGCALGEDLYH